VGTTARYEGNVDASSARVAIVAGRFNERFTAQLLDGAEARLRKYDVPEEQVSVVWVPGAFELPLVAKRLAASGAYDAVICLGAVIRGHTPHFDFVAGACASGLTQAALETGRPIVFGVLTTDDETQAAERADPTRLDKGGEAASTALEMVDLLRQLSEPGTGPRD
jgi:6,7-dimethyl-8-ribityllumazine synthase